MQTKTTSPTSPPPVMPLMAHRRQRFWQIWVPLLITLIVVLGFAILAIVGAAGGNPQVEHFANVSAVIVIVPWLIIGVLIFAIVGGSAYGVFWILTRMRGWMLKAQLFMVQFALAVRRASDSATKPVMSANTFSARVGALRRRVFRRNPAGKSTP